MMLNFAVATLVASLTPRPPEHVRRLVEEIRVPKGAGEAHEISA